MNIYRQRLLNVALALVDEAVKRKQRRYEGKTGRDDEFYMGNYVNRGCGTPSCAFGHYAARIDLQDAFKIGGCDVIDIKSGWPAEFDSAFVQEHFGLNKANITELFCSTGCGGANTELEAALYIESFCEQHVWLGEEEP